jgi:hypothetical protein
MSIASPAPGPGVDERDAPSATGLAQVLRHPGVWRRSAPPTAALAAQRSGYAAFDALLPGGGWPLGALSEILLEHDGLGELMLVLPALVELARVPRRIVMVAPPYLPYAPALAAAGLDLAQLTLLDAPPPDAPWAIEQCLRAGCCGAVLGWLPRVDYTALRRLQLAAEHGGGLGFLFRDARAAAQPSPAALRVRLVADGGGSRLELVKCRGQLELQCQRLRWRA